MNRLMSLITSIGLGAGLMYFYDPARGNRRRALVRDQFNSMINDVDEAIEVGMTDLRNRTRGFLAEGMSMVSDEGAPDWLLEERVRAEIGRIGHAGGVQVRADGGRIYLSGPVLADEENRVVTMASRVRGVKGVENQMEVHQEPGDIPALQGKEQLGDPTLWSPSARLIGSTAGGILALYGALRKGLVGTALTTAGLGLVARSVTNMDMKSMLGISRERRGIHVTKAINIQASPEDVYRYWQNFENFPRFMAHIKQINDLGNDRSHWVVAGPAGTEVEWDAIVTRNIPNQEIAWESVPGSQVETAGKVQFHENAEGGTRVTVQMDYNPPAGALGHAVASLLGSDPRAEMNEDLNRLKSLLETGKTTVQGQEVNRPGMAGATD